MVSVNNLEPNITIYELCNIITSYLLSKEFEFNYKKSKSSSSCYFQIKNPRIKIRVSSHWQENCNEIQIISVFDLAKLFDVLK
jgi:hypothetical protein